jgi:hypothetical protein
LAAMLLLANVAAAEFHRVLLFPPVRHARIWKFCTPQDCVYILENSALQQHARTFFKLYTPRVGSEMQKRCSQSCWKDENFAVFLLRVRFIGDVMCAAKRPHTPLHAESVMQVMCGQLHSICATPFKPIIFPFTMLEFLSVPVSLILRKRRINNF